MINVYRCYYALFNYVSLGKKMEVDMMIIKETHQNAI